MVYDKKLPPVRDLLSLAQLIKFPEKRRVIEKIAKQAGYSKFLTDFLELFPPEETFISKVDFMTRSEELELLIGQERSMPFEILRSPQD